MTVKEHIILKITTDGLLLEVILAIQRSDRVFGVQLLKLQQKSQS